MEEQTDQAHVYTRARGFVAVLRDPVVVILFLAGLFDGLSGNPIHSILLISAAVALTWEGMVGRPIPPPTESVPPLAAPTRNPSTRAGLIAGGIVFAVIVGQFGRYSWPATVPVVLLGAVAVVIAWRGRSHTPAPAPLGPVGAITWAALFVALSLWELTNLLLQPSFTTDSYAHPTLSVLTDPILASHLGRSVALLAWLAFGWFLVER